MQQRSWAAATAALVIATAAPAAQAAPDRSVTAGANIPADAYTFVERATSSCTHHVATTGSDANSGTSPTGAWRTPAKAFQSLAPGQRACIHAGTYDVVTLDPARSGTASAPIAITEAPGEAKPILRSTGDSTLLSFGSGDAYWVVQGLDFNKNRRGGATVQVLGSSTAPAHHIAVRQSVIRDGMSGAAVLIRHSASNVLVAGNEIHGHHLWRKGDLKAYTRIDSGYLRADANGVNLEGTADAQVARVRLEANDIHDNGGDGVQCIGVDDTGGPRATDPADLDIVDNRLRFNEEDAADIKSCQRVSIRGSRSPELAGSAAASKLYGYRPTDRSADMPGNHSGGGAIVIHYFARQVEVKNTRIWDSCRGISVGRDDLDGVRDISISRTLIFGLVSGENCPGMGVNVVLAQRVDLFHNSFAGIPDTAIRIGTDNGGSRSSSDVDVFNNVIEGRYWLDLYRPRVSGFESDRNVVWNPDGSSSHMKLDFNRTALADWQRLTGQDATSRHGDPLWIDQPVSNDYYTRSGSPARDSALNTVDAAFCGAAPDIGFRESGC